MQNWARVNFLAARQRQMDLQRQNKIRKMIIPRWPNGAAMTNMGHNAKINNFEAWKHGHVVAAVLSHVQLSKKVSECVSHIWPRQQ